MTASEVREDRGAVPGRSASRNDELQVLLIEDSAADAELLVALLSREVPALVHVAPTLAHARGLFAEPLDIVITDLSLPDADGLQALTEVRSALPSVPVLVMTGLNDRHVAMAALTAGADDYLVKGAYDGRGVATAVLYAVQRRRAEAGTRRPEGFAMSLLDAMEAPTCAVDEHGDIVAANPAWSEFSTRTAGAVGVGASYFDLYARGEMADAVAGGLRRLLSGELSRFELDYPCHASEPPRWFSLRMNPLPDGAGAVLTHVDVTVAKQAEQALAHQTMHDTLTGLPNRLLLNDRLLQALAAAQRAGEQVGVAFLDLDQLKRINDSLGHSAGDELLLSVATRLRQCVRAGDTLARIAGDQFVVVWPGLQRADEAEALAERLRASFGALFELQDATLSLSPSVGVAVGVAPDSPDELLLAADAAMYDAKIHHRGRTRMRTSEFHDGAEARLRNEAELREAVAAGDFVLHYQPVVDLKRGRVTGVEALVRWQRPEGLRYPDTFIPDAEASGLIVPLGAWVLDEACRQAASWAADGLVLDVAVNLSVRQLSSPDVLATIEQALDRHGLDPQRLLLEVTESAVMEDAEAAQTALERIAALGAAIAIDDFGTGCSSLLYLKRYPVRALKIDRTFVSGIGVHDDDDAVVASIVRLACAVGSACIAEGVENAEQQAVLVALGCDQAQGYLFGRPVRAQDLPDAVVAAEQMLGHKALTAIAAAPPAAEPVDHGVIGRIDQLRRAGASAHTIAAALNREGAPHPQGVKWHRVAVTQVARGRLPEAPRRRISAPPQPVPRHEVDAFADADDLMGRLVERTAATLQGPESVLVLAVDAHASRLEEELAARGLDLSALRDVERYRSLDADAVLDRITVDGYLSARLFRDVVGVTAEAAASRHGRLQVYSELMWVLWDRGEVASALALEELWRELAKRVPLTVVCGYAASARGASALATHLEDMHGEHGPAA